MSTLARYSGHFRAITITHAYCHTCCFWTSIASWCTVFSHQRGVGWTTFVHKRGSYATPQAGVLPCSCAVRCKRSRCVSCSLTGMAYPRWCKGRVQLFNVFLWGWRFMIAFSNCQLNRFPTNVLHRHFIHTVPSKSSCFLPTLLDVVLQFGREKMSRITKAVHRCTCYQACNPSSPSHASHLPTPTRRRVPTPTVLPHSHSPPPAASRLPDSQTPAPPMSHSLSFAPPPDTSTLPRFK